MSKIELKTTDGGEVLYGGPREGGRKYAEKLFAEAKSKKQIEEMAKVMAYGRFVEPNENQIRLFIGEAESLYNAGYRKQSEWISVEERLPQVTGKYICCVKDKGENTWTIPADWSLELKMWFGEFGEIKNMVTHWMPLPEPPKKGGAE